VVDVSAVPALARAQHRHQEIRMGHQPDQVRQAGGVVDDVLARWAGRQHVLHTRWQQRSETLAQSNGVNAVAWSVAQYPEYVILLDLLSDPHWVLAELRARDQRAATVRRVHARTPIPARSAICCQQ
jgi:hypothetical protein